MTPYQRWLRSSDTPVMVASDRTLQLLRQASTATISTQLLARGLRNTFLHGLKPITHAKMAGPAFTLRCIPAREDIDTLDVYKDYDHPQRKAIETIPAGHVLVIDCRGQTRAASAGGILATRLQVRGAAGLVTDGALRDTPEIAKLNLPVYAQGASPLTNLVQHHAAGHQCPDRLRGGPDLPGRHHGRGRRGRGLRPAAPGGRGGRSRARAGSSSRRSSRTRSATGSRSEARIRRTRPRSGATTTPDRRASHTPTDRVAGARAGRASSKLRIVLKRTSSPLNSHAAAATALSPAVDARGLGSAAKDALSVGTDPTGAFIF